MQKQNKPLILALLACLALSGAAHATLIGRDLNGSPGSFEAYYDDDLGITWLANANMNGLMDWTAANAWAASLSFTDGTNTYANWRLPIVTDTGIPGCNFAYSGTDCGYNVDTATGEMAHLFYDELGNKAYYDTSGNAAQPGWGLTNTGPFTNLQPNAYWSATEYAPDTGYAWDFYFNVGNQGAASKVSRAGFYALAVSPGDVGAANNNTVPEPQTLALMGLGLLGLAVARRRG